MQTLVSVGPYRFHIAAAGQSVRSRASAAIGKTSPAKRTSRGAREARTVQPAVLGQEREDRRRRVPDADPPLGQEVAEPAGVLAQVFTDQHQRRRGLAGGEEVEDRQVEMERGMRGEAIVVVPGAERLPAPVEEREGIGVREHHSLGLAGRARGEEDVRQVVRRAGRQERRRRIIGDDLGPGGIARIDRDRRRGLGCRASAGRLVLGIRPSTTIRRGGGPLPGHAARRAGTSSAATTAALTPLAARMPAARAAGPVGSTGTYDAPVRRMPWIAVTASRLLGNQRPTRSPRSTPQRASRVASAIRPVQELGIAQPPAVLVLHGRYGRAAARRPRRAVGLNGVHPWA